MDLVNDVLHGSRLALTRLLTKIEDETIEGQEALDKLFSYSGKAQVTSISFLTGSGKSTLVNCLVNELRDVKDREKPQKVAVIAVDPSSPFTGGALLGDRLRMRAISADPDIFIRSMASRGALGGLAKMTLAVALALDAAGYGIIIIETVGAGQSEVEIAKLAHTTIVVEAPGLGDDIQAAKSGILEIADILVVNKADQPGVDAAEGALKAMLWMGYSDTDISAEQEKGKYQWVPPLIRTVAINGEGVQKLADEVRRHMAALQESREWQSRTQQCMSAFVKQLLMRELQSRASLDENSKNYQQVMAKVYDKKLSPYQAVQELLSN